MNDEKWENLMEKIKNDFGILSKDKEERENDKICETVIFKGPTGKVKLERISKPLILDKKFKYSHRQGADAKVEYITSDTEKTHRVEAFMWNEDLNEWKGIDTEGISNF